MKKTFTLLWIMAIGCIAFVFTGCNNKKLMNDDVIVNRVTDIYNDMASRYNASPQSDVARQLDSLYCSKEWNKLVSDIYKKDANINGVGFFEADHWVMGQDFQNVSADSIIVENFTGDTATVSLNLHNCGTTTIVRLSMVEEDNEWKIDNFVDTNNDFNWKESMKSYLNTEELVFDSIGKEQSDTTAEVKIHVEYPVSGNAVLVDSLRKYIAEVLGVDAKLANNKDALLKAAVDKGYATMKESREEMLVDRSEIPPFYYDYQITKIAEGNDYLTMHSKYEEFQGGAHGGAIAIGTTFRKSNGKRMGWNMLKNTASPQFRNLIKKGLKDYFKEAGEDVVTDEQLKDNLIIEGGIENLPLPQNPPTLEKNGMLFCYQQYEIAAYAIGMPSFILSFDELLPFLTEEAKEMIK